MVALRTVTKLLDLDDVSGTPAAGAAPVSDGAGEFVLTPVVAETLFDVAHETDGTIGSASDLPIASDTDASGAGDIIFKTGGAERARIKADGTVTGVLADSRASVSIEELLFSTPLPTASYTVYANHPVLVCPIPAKIADAWLSVFGGTLAANDTNYWAISLVRRPGKFVAPPFAIPFYRDMILAESGLLDYWMLGETSGTSAVDSKTPANNGTYQVAAASGVRGVPGVADSSANERAYALNGTTSAVVTPSFSMPWGAGGSYECWVYPDLHTTARQTLIGIENTAIAQPSLEIAGNAFPGTGNNGLQVVGSGVFVVQTDSNFPGLEQHRWSHVVYTRSAGTGLGTHKIYVNGVSIGFGQETALTYATGAAARGLGRRAAASQMFTGRMAHVAFYNRALTQTEVTNHYNYDREIVRKTTRVRDGEAFTQYVSWPFSSYLFSAVQTILQQGDTIEIQLEPCGSPAAISNIGLGLRYEPV